MAEKLLALEEKGQHQCDTCFKLFPFIGNGEWIPTTCPTCTGSRGHLTKEEMMKYDIYEKSLQDLFAGSGTETIIAENQVVQAHIRAWGNPEVIEETWAGQLRGQSVKTRGSDWQQLTGFDLENAQGWASEVVDYLKL